MTKYPFSLFQYILDNIIAKPNTINTILYYSIRRTVNSHGKSGERTLAIGPPCAIIIKAYGVQKNQLPLLLSYQLAL